jgi:hypothetical protein
MVVECEAFNIASVGSVGNLEFNGTEPRAEARIPSTPA